MRLISLSELHGEYSEYGVGFLTPRGTQGRLLSSIPTHRHTNNNKDKKKENGSGTSFVFISIHSFIVCPGSSNVDRHDTIDGPEIHFVRHAHGGCLKLSLELK